MNKFYKNFLGGKSGTWNLIILCLLMFVIIPLSLDAFRVNNFAKYLSFGFVAIGLVICWGHGGILSLGQGVFWGLGGYCMAAFLKLEAARDIAGEKGSDTLQALTTKGLPDFMDWNQITVLPWFWHPFNSLTLTLILMIVVPGLLAYILGTAMFKRRVGGVYFSIITLAIAWMMEILFVTRQGWTGGINGITDLRTLKGWDITSPHAQYILYFLTCALLVLCIITARGILGSRLGRLLVALRDEEDRVRFSGYDTANFKRFAFVVAAIMAAIGGALFVLSVGFMSPKLVSIEPSIYMVIFCAVGGRMSVIGSVYGVLLVSFARSYLSDAFPAFWYYLMGGVFIIVPRYFPDGLAGIWNDYTPYVARFFHRLIFAGRRPEVSINIGSAGIETASTET